jgi:peptidoglycan/xylan/chitin deacetylase (PgdA/CDA1 family)
MPCSFRFEHYKEILEKALKNGYKIIRFKDLPLNLNEKRVILLRHDVDSRLDRALECARLEKSLGVSATYFIRVHSPQYNPFEYKSYKILREIKETGHEIGLHYEVVYLNYLTGEDMLNLLEREKKVLESIINEEIKSAAPLSVVGYEVAEGGPMELGLPLKEDPLKEPNSWERISLFHPYLPEVANTFKLIHESGGKWSPKCAHLLIGKEVKIQLLTHPQYWYYPDNPW